MLTIVTSLAFLELARHGFAGNHQQLRTEPRRVARFVSECFQHRRYDAPDLLPYFSREDMGGPVDMIYDTFSSDFVRSEDGTTSGESEVGYDAHGAEVGSSTGAPL